MSAPVSTGALLDHTQQVVLVVDATGTVAHASGAIERRLGHSSAAVEGESLFCLVHPADEEGVRASLRAVAEGETPDGTSTDHRFRDAEGEWHWFESRLTEVPDGDDSWYLVCSGEVTERVRAQQERDAVARQLQELSASAGDVLWMFDADWSELLFVNPAYEDVYGQPVETVEADPERFMQTVHPADRDAVREAMAKLSGGDSVDMEYRVNPARNYAVWVWVQAEPIVEDGEVVRITGFTRDVTDRHRRARQLVVLDNLLRHNLRNEVNVILGTVEQIEEAAPEVDDLTAVIRQTGESLLTSAEKEREIVEVLQGGAERCTLDASAIVREAVATVREELPDATVDVSAPAQAPVGALEELSAAVVELVENAALHGDGAVRVDVESGPEWVTIAIADDGPRLPAVEAAVLEGADEMCDVYHSSGLGLWLAYWIVELSEGGIDVRPDDDGNRVVVRVPRA